APEDVLDGAALALAPSGRPEGLVAEENRVAEGHGRSNALVIDGAAVARDALTATGHVADEGGVADGRRRGGVAAEAVEARVVLDGPADAEVDEPGGCGRVGGAQRLVVDERAVG